MANLLADPNLWADYGGSPSPSTSWGGEGDPSYYFTVGPTQLIALSYIGPEIEVGDVIEGEAWFQWGNEELETPLYLLLLDAGENLLAAPVELTSGDSYNFSYTFDVDFSDQLATLVMSYYAEGIGTFIEDEGQFTFTPIGGPPPDVLVANPDSGTTQAGQPVTINVLANDTLNGEPVTLGDLNSVLAIIAQPEHGSVVVNENGSSTYTPEEGFSGTDNFGYLITSGSVASSATVTITVKEANSICPPWWLCSPKAPVEPCPVRTTEFVPFNQYDEEFKFPLSSSRKPSKIVRPEDCIVCAPTLIDEVPPDPDPDPDPELPSAFVRLSIECDLNEFYFDDWYCEDSPWTDINDPNNCIDQPAWFNANEPFTIGTDSWTNTYTFDGNRISIVGGDNSGIECCGNNLGLYPLYLKQGGHSAIVLDPYWGCG